MVAFTPNFNLPYAQPADPADVPLRMQELAEAIDAALHTQELRARPRYMAQFLGTIPNIVPGTSTLGPLTWQTTDFNTFYPDFFPQPAVGPLTDPSTIALPVNLPGFWFIFGSVQIPSTPAAANIDELGCEILINGTSSPQRCRSSTHETQTAGDPTHLIDAAAGVLLNPGDTVGLRAFVRRTSGAAAVTFGRRSLTLLRMTQS